MDDLWQHQRDIVARGRSQRQLLVAADMGCGKTRAVIELCRDDQFLLVVSPVAVGPAWEKQFSLWEPDRRVYSAYSGTAKRRMAAVDAAMAADGPVALLLNYDWFWRDSCLPKLMALAGRLGDEFTLIADECHRAKSPAGKASRALHRLSRAAPRSRRLGLTGTPMPHSPADIYAQARFLNESTYGANKTAFMSRYFFLDPVYPSRIVGRRDDTDFEARLDRLAYRVRADDVLDLPEAIHETIHVDLPAAVRGVYGQVEKAVIVELSGGLVTATNALTKLLRLRQITSSHVGTDAGLRRLEPVPAKIAAIEEWLEDLPAGEPVAIFTTFTDELDCLREMCERRGRKYAELSGRQKTLAEWQRGDRDFLGVQLQAGGVGVDLTTCGSRPCRYVAYMSVSFSLGDYEQSLARVRRPGQRAECVRYYHLVASGTIDEAIYKALSAKRDVVEEVLAGLLSRTKEGCRD